MIKKIYCDMDGVLVDFNDHYERCFGTRWNNIENVEERWKPLNDNPSWFATIPMKDGAVELLQFLDEFKVPVKLLTATGHNWIDVGTAKLQWCDTHLGHGRYDMLTVVHGRDKFHFAQAGSVLIDDMERNVIPWREAGGTGIVHVNTDDTIRQIQEYLVA